MGGGDNEITIKTLLDTSGFQKGSQKLQQAIKGIGSAAKSVGNSARGSFNGMMSVVRRIAPMIIGIGSAYQIVSRAVSAFMAENQALSAKMSSIWSSLGNILGPIITQIIDWVSTAVSWFIQFLSLLGITAKNSEKAAKGAGGAASELKKTIAGFDELNTLSPQGGGGGGAGKAGLEAKDLPDWIKALSEALKNKLWDDAADIIIGKFNNLIKVAKDKAYEWGKKVGEYFAGAVHILARFIREVNWNDIGRAVARLINGLFEDVDPRELGTILVGKFAIAFRMLTGFLEDLDFGELARNISGIFIGIFDTIADAIKKADFVKIGRNIRKFFENIDWVGVKNSFLGLLRTACQGALNLLWGLLGLPDKAPSLFDKLDKEKIKDTFLTIISKPVQDALDLLWDVLDMPGESPKIKEILSGIVDNIITLKDKIIEFVDSAFSGKLKEFLNFEGDGGGITAFIKNLSDAFNKLLSVAKDTGILNFLTVAWDTIKEMVTVTVGTATDAIPAMLSGLGESLSSLPSSMTSLVESLGRLWNEFLMPALGQVAGSGAVEALVYAIAEAFQMLASIVGPVVDGLVRFYNDFIRPMLDVALEGIIDQFRDLGDIFNLISQWVSKKISFKELIAGLGDVATGANDVTRAVNESSDAAIKAIAQMAEFAANNVGLYEDFGTASQYVQNMRQGIEEYTQSLIGNVEGNDRAKEAIENLKQAMSDIGDRYAEAVNGCTNTTQANQLAAEMQAELAAITQEYVQLLAEQGIVLDENGQVVQETAEAVEKQAAAQKEAANALDESAKATVEANASLQETPSVAQDATEGVQNLGTTAEEATGVFEEEVKNMNMEVKGNLDEMGQGFNSTSTEIEGTMNTFGSNLQTIVRDSSVSMRDDFQVGMTEMGQVASAATQDMNSVFSWNFAVIANNAYRWGQDIIINLNNGIMSLVGQFEGNIASLAAMIRSYLGFSEPEKGPLSNFHTFMPDMMKLLSKGIQDNVPLAEKAAQNVAETISDELQDGDYKIGDIEGAELDGALEGFSDKIIAGFSNLVDALSTIADNVVFSMPSVAGGGVLPYGVDGSWDGLNNKDENSELLLAVDDLRGMIGDLRNSLDNMQWVAQFGDLRALAQQVTRIQRANERANG